MVSPEWLLYQEQAGAVFKSLGCSVAIDAKVQGVRSNHRVDVLVRFSRWGLPQVWLIECKHLKRRVTKSAVETLKSIVMDVGADKGFLLSEVGFQPAAAAAASFTNIGLLSLSALNDAVKPDVERLLLAQLEIQVLDLMKTLRSFDMAVPHESGINVIRGKPGVDVRHVMCGIGALLGLRDAIQGAKIGEFRGAVLKEFPCKEERLVHLSELPRVLTEGERLILEVRAWVQKQKDRMQRAEHLLARIRTSAARRSRAGHDLAP